MRERTVAEREGEMEGGRQIIWMIMRMSSWVGAGQKARLLV